MGHVWRRRETFTEHWWEELKGRHHLGDPRIDKRVILKWILAETGGHGACCPRVQGLMI